MAAKQAVPPDPASSPWLHVAAPVGKVGSWFLIGANFLLLFAPLVFLLNAADYLDPQAPGGTLMLLFSDPTRVLAIADLVSVIGVVILACTLFVILFGLIRAERRVGLDVYLLGIVTLACLVAWVPVMAYALGRARGTITDVDAAAATGGWSVAAGLLLAASLAYLFFTIRLEDGTGVRKLGSFKWPIYAAVNLLGSAAIAGYVQGGGTNVDAFSLGLVLKVTLIPMLGVMAYQDLRDKFPLWRAVPLQAVPDVAARPAPPAVRPAPSPPVIGRVMGRFVERPVPTFVAGSGVAMPLPPPPDD